MLAKRIIPCLDIKNGRTVKGINFLSLADAGDPVENAVRYNKPGGKVWVTVRAEGAHAVLAVKDTGVGIPEKDIPRVCERFYRVDKDRSRNSGGTGLGLAIVKHMVRRYDGELEIRSQLGEGSEFTVRIPADR